MSKIPGSLPDGWIEIQLGKVAQLSGRIGWKGLTAKEYTKNGPLFLSVHSLNYGDYVDFRDAFHISQERYDESPEIMLRPNDVLICKDGAGIGKLGIVGDLPGETTINSSLLLVRAQDSILPKYLYYILSSPYFQGIVMSRLMGATTPHLYQRDIAEFPIYLPPLREQQLIVAILDEVLSGLATATANAKKNLKNARELFDSYLKSVFAGKKDGWKEACIGEVCQLQSGATVDKRLERTTGEFPYLKVADMTFEGNEERIFSSSRFLNKKDIRLASLLPVGTTIFPKRGGAILTNKKRLTAVPICADLNIMGVLPSSAILPEFVFMYFLSIDMRKLGSGSSIPQINNYDVAPLPINFPADLKEQEKLVREFKKYQAAVRGLEEIYRAKMNGLVELKRSILQKAFSGKLTFLPSTMIKEAAE